MPGANSCAHRAKPALSALQGYLPLAIGCVGVAVLSILGVIVVGAMLIGGQLFFEVRIEFQR